ncbi:MAG: hypothetical protein WA030_02405 [Candidatus Microsaccharimonas sp.]
MNTERPIPTYLSLGTDIDESRMNLDTILLEALGDEQAVRRWKATSHPELDDKSPEVVIHIDPDKVVRAAFALKNRT